MAGQTHSKVNRHIFTTFHRKLDLLHPPPPPTTRQKNFAHFKRAPNKEQIHDHHFQLYVGSWLYFLQIFIQETVKLPSLTLLLPLHQLQQPSHTYLLEATTRNVRTFAGILVILLACGIPLTLHWPQKN
jgi:hypothetical protein